MNEQTEFQEAFREEAIELLNKMEEVVLQLESEPDNQDLVHHLFRIMHTIKGSGAMFGFQKIANFAHRLETELDAVRNGKTKLSLDFIKILLASRDLIQEMIYLPENELEAFDGQIQKILSQIAAMKSPTDMAASIPSSVAVTTSARGTTTNILATQASPLITALKVEKSGQAGSLLQETPEADEEGNLSSPPSTPSMGVYRLRIKLSPQVMTTGLDPLCLFKDLEGLGECAISAHTDLIPDLEDFNPEECYLYWDAALATTARSDEIREIFLFVEDESEISITSLYYDLGSEGEVNYKKLGEILVERGDLSQEEVEKVLSKQKRTGQLMVEEGLVIESKIASALAEQKIIQKVQASKAETNTIRVSTEKLDRLINLVGELVITQAQLSQTSRVYKNQELLSPVENVERLTGELRDCALNIRMLPIESTFGKFRRLVHDLSANLGKEIDLVTEGGETELDKTVIERIHDPLVHIIRNSIDHGLEVPEVRRQAGKNPCGTIRLSAGQAGGEVVITIEDNGGGLNKEKIRAKAIERNLIKETDTLTEGQIYNLIFQPGFSTAEQVTDVSGRGVGMDVVKREIAKLRGSVEIQSNLGQGTTISIRLPLTLAIIEGLLISTNSMKYVIPLTFVEECVELTAKDRQRFNHRHIIQVRGETIPYVRLREIFFVQGENLPKVEYVVIVTIEGRRIGVVTDAIIGNHQAVIKSLGKVYEHVEGVSGATILGDGTIALILDLRQIKDCATRLEQEMLNAEAHLVACA